MPSTAPKSARTKKPAASVLPLETLAVRHVVSLARGKFYYKKADAALDALLKQAKTGDVIVLPNEKPVPTAYRGKTFRVTDKFASKNSIGVGLSARRFELEEIATP
ncbi:MAG: hypothetical protein JWO19_4442 [Bryobacterales bacterium]|nr:hypothetical protein [Bryobacterales bacterium]